MKFAVIIEKGKRNYSAYVPDLPGCVTTGTTLAETERLIREAIEFHIEGMLLHGEPVPEATTVCSLVEIDVDRIAAEVRSKQEVP